MSHYVINEHVEIQSYYYHSFNDMKAGTGHGSSLQNVLGLGYDIMFPFFNFTF